MRKFFLSCFLLALIACGPGDQVAESTVSMGTPDGYAVSCANLYTRLVPHYCVLNGNGGLESWSVTTAGCNTRTLTIVPSSAKGVRLSVNYFVYSTNVVNLKTISSGFYSSAACGTLQTSTGISLREEVAVVANTQLAAMSQYVDAIVVNGTVVTNSTFTNVGSNSFIQFDIVGYYD